jgi:hypothetical protein
MPKEGRKVGPCVALTEQFHPLWNIPTGLELSVRGTLILVLGILFQIVAGILNARHSDL